MMTMGLAKQLEEAAKRVRSAKARSVRQALRYFRKGKFSVKGFVGDNGEPMSLVKPNVRSDHAWEMDSAESLLRDLREELGKHYDTDLDRTPKGIPVLWVVQKGTLYAAAPWKIPVAKL